MKFKLITLMVCVTILFSSTITKAASFSDISGHWAEETIIKWADYGVINGYDGKFAPDDELTRAQMATILSNLLGLTQRAENNYADVNNNDWYADAILKCTYAGIMSGDGTNANPNSPITREQAMVMIARALKANGEYTLSRQANDFTDISSWASEYVYALYNNKYVNGVGDNMIMPKANITRAAIITIFNNMIARYINTPGEYEIDNNSNFVVLKGNGITVKSQSEDLNIIIADGYSYSFVNLKKQSDGKIPSSSVGSNSGSSSNTSSKKYYVKFYGKDNELLLQQQISKGESAVPPEIKSIDGYVFDGWNDSFTNITEDTQIKSNWLETSNYENYFILPSICCEKEETISIPLNLTGNVDLCGFDLSIAFNPEVLDFVKFENEDDDVILNYNKETGIIHANFSSTKNVNGEIDICNLVFKVLKANEKTSIDINVKEAIKVLENGDFEKLNCNVHNCKLVSYR